MQQRQSQGWKFWDYVAHDCLHTAGQENQCSRLETNQIPPSATSHPQQTHEPAMHCSDILPGVIHDCVQPVCNGQHGAVLKLCPDGHLDEVISLQVDGGRGLVQDQDPGFAQESSGQAHELPLANAAGTDRLHRHLCSAGYPKKPEIFYMLPGLSAPEFTRAGCSMPTLTVTGSVTARQGHQMCLLSL